MKEPPRPRVRAARRPHPTPPARSGPVDVSSLDADALLKDACAVLQTHQPSGLLHAIDTGTMTAVMSDQAYRELGWMSAPAARGHNVDHDDLRAIVIADYLPRIPVVTVPDGNQGHWMPRVTDVTDPKDVVHLQVAFLISGTVVLSHDRDLRIPGHAPRFRANYDERLDQLNVLAGHREAEDGAGLMLVTTVYGIHKVVTHGATKLRLSKAIAWSALGLSAVAALYWANSSPGRRTRISETLDPVISTISDAYARAGHAENAVKSSRLLAPRDTERLEVRVAAHLMRNPGKNMGDIAYELELGAHEQAQLSSLLGSHPAFERVSRYGWAVGRTRDKLETEPSKSWRPAETSRSPS